MGDDTEEGIAQNTSFYFFKIFLIPFLILLSQPFLIVFQIYDKIHWIDIPFHFFGGASIAVSYVLFFIELRKKWYWTFMEPFIFFVFIVALVGTTGLVWELAEFSSDTLFYTAFQEGNADTMKDLFFDIMGGIVGCSVVLVVVGFSCLNAPKTKRESDVH